jgi:hypothetical protein
MSFYGNIMKHDHFFHTLRFLYFCHNMILLVRTDKNYERPPKIISLFHMLNDTYSKFYSQCENLVIDEDVVLFKRRITFKQYVPKKHEYFHTKIMNFAT